MAGIGGLITSCARSRPVGNPSVPEPAKPVDLSRYLGRWYEIARYESGFERDCEGVTADYSLRPDGMIRVLNICHKGAPREAEYFVDELSLICSAVRPPIQRNGSRARICAPELRRT